MRLTGSTNQLSWLLAGVDPQIPSIAAPRLLVTILTTCRPTNEVWGSSQTRADPLGEEEELPDPHSPP